MQVTKADIHGRVRYRVSFQSAGKQHRRFFANREDAAAFAGQIREEKSRLGDAWSSLSLADRAGLVAAHEWCRERGIRMMDALAWYEKHRTVAEPQSSPPLGLTVEECLIAKEGRGLKPSSLKNLACSLRGFVQALTPGRRMAAIAPEDVERYLAGRPWSPRRRRGVLADIACLFAWAFRKGYVAANPCARIEKPIITDAPPALLTVQQCRTILAAAVEHDPKLVPYVAVGLFAGLRPSELDALRWQDVEIERGHLEVTAEASKTRRRRLVTIQPNLAAWLTAYRSGDLPAVNIRRRWDGLRKKAGLWDGWPHDAMRHSFVSYHLALFGSADRTALEAGHSVSTLFKHYRELVRKEDAAEFWGLFPSPIGGLVVPEAGG